MSGAAAGWRAALGVFRLSFAARRTLPLDVAPTSVPRPVIDVLDSHHVVSIATADEAGPWAASCFYAFDAAAMQLIVMTSATTRHGRAMLARRRVSGTVAGQPTAITDIRGLQFEATAALLEGTEQKKAMRRFVRRHPPAAVMPSDVWALKLEAIKYTDNRIVFARKLHWSRTADERREEGGAS